MDGEQIRGVCMACPDEVLQLGLWGEAENAKLGMPEASWGHSPVEIVLLGVLWA